VKAFPAFKMRERIKLLTYSTGLTEQILGYHKQVLNKTLEPEFSVQCKRPSINGHTLFCMFLAESFSGCLVLTTSHCASTTVNFWCQNVKQHSSNNSTEWQTYMSIDHPCSKQDLTYANLTLHVSSENKCLLCVEICWLASGVLACDLCICVYWCLIHCTVLKSSSIITCVNCTVCAIFCFKLHAVPRHHWEA
jgi:hypothetical protein